jgi:hypothetical protein
LYHEGEGYEAGYFGYTKPFSEAIYGNYEVVEMLGNLNGSPLDIPYTARAAWDAGQFKVYTQVVLITLKDFLKRKKSVCVHSFALHRALGDIGSETSCAYKIDGSTLDAYSSDASAKLGSAVDFASQAVDALDAQEGLTWGPLRRRPSGPMDMDFCGDIAELMFELILHASAVKGSQDLCWWIQHNTVWIKFFDMEKTRGWTYVRFRLRRLLFEEIQRMDRLMPNYKSARILGFCLNVMGFNAKGAGDFGRSERGLQKLVITWTKKNYLRVHRDYPDVAKACLMGGVAFDEQGSRLVKTYAKGIEREPDRAYLTLDPPPPLVATDAGGTA